MSPSAGSSITKNETVTLTISQGPEILETTVPALYNTPEAEARNALDANHLTCTEVQSQYNNDIAQGNVIYQSIEAGSVVEQGTGVLLIVSAGPDPALQNVPYVGSITIRTKDLLIPDVTDFGEEISLILPDKMPDAFICNDCRTAYKLIHNLEGLEYSIPKDISVAAFDDGIFADIGIPKLTTYSINYNTMAQLAAESIALKLENPNFHVGKKVVHGNVVVRDSVKRAK